MSRSLSVSDCNPFLWPVSFFCLKTLLRISEQNLVSRGQLVSLFCLDTQTVLYLCQRDNLLTAVLPTSPLHAWRMVLKCHSMGNFLSLSQSAVVCTFSCHWWFSTFFFHRGVRGYIAIFSGKIAGIDKFHFLCSLICKFLRWIQRIYSIQNVSVNKFQKFNFIRCIFFLCKVRFYMFFKNKDVFIDTKGFYTLLCLLYPMFSLSYPTCNYMFLMLFLFI